jgi:lipid kinase YegS
MPMARVEHWRLIVNGNAANAAGLREAVQARRERGFRVDVRLTWEHGDARRHVEAALRDRVDCVFAAGGDGTLGEVAGALAEHVPDEDAPDLAIIPLGTANDFATAAGIPADIEGAFDLAGEPARRVDILRVKAGPHLRWCMNLATGGFGTQATTDVHDGLKKYLGGLSYLLGGVAALARAESRDVELRGPGFRWSGAMIALGVGNARQAGAGQVLCPDALIDDGLLDVAVVRELSGELAATLATALTDGRQAALDDVAERWAMPWVEITADGPLTLNLDGEPVEATRFRVDCLPARLRLRLPASCPLLRNVPAGVLHAVAAADRVRGAEPL